MLAIDRNCESCEKIFHGTGDSEKWMSYDCSNFHTSMFTDKESTLTSVESYKKNAGVFERGRTNHLKIAP